MLQPRKNLIAASARRRYARPMAGVLVITLLLAQSASAAPRPGDVNAPCAAPEYRQFDFWVGDWVVHGPKGRQVGTNRIEKIEKGCGLLEQWTNARGITGRSISIYRPAARTWTQAWAGSDGLTLVLEGRLEGEAMVLEGESLGPRGERLRDRVRWSPLEGGKVRQLWEQSRDAGKTWTVAFDGMYTRKLPE